MHPPQVNTSFTICSTFKNIKQKSIIDFSVVNLDSIVVSVTIGVVFLFIFWLAARKATSGVPGRFQAAVEMMVGMVDNQAKANIHNAGNRASSSLLWH